MIFKRGVSSSEVDSLREEIASLREEVATLRRQNIKMPDRVADAVQPVVELSKLSSALLPPVSFGGYSLTSSAALKLVRTVVERRPRNILEFGTGQSTAWMARLLADVGYGRLVSLEDDPEYYESIGKELESLPGFGHLELRLAGLKPLESGELWYDPSTLEDIADVDFLVIDGPSDRSARRPTFEQVVSKLVPGCDILIDDVHTPDMKKLVGEWLEDHPLDVVDANWRRERLLHLRLQN
ncbi:class I SAM-dependent methyltransferase [Nesterenkonia populi]|uniref:class I SAM-dependent methyltransferase n=1 Tax=Nesterenkonia populi TaxID=1591087 RepID=UPI0011BED307|nr:class I SAM-dependent methyltransferase [Nesterenkonia populi]